MLPDIALNVKDFPFKEPKQGISDTTKLLLMYFHPFRNENLEEIQWAPFQLTIIDAIVNRSYKGKKRIHIMCATQSGKSVAVAAGVLIRAALLPEKWAIVAGTTKQARIIMQYIINFATDNPLFCQELEMEKNALERLKRERSKNVLTFKKGGRIQILSAEIREGEKSLSSSRGKTGIMGQGSPNVICLPFNEKILTNEGYIEIGKIVENKLRVQILSYNHRTKKVEFKNIENYEKNKGRDLIEIDIGDRKITCTEDHPIYVKGKGYIKARDVKINDTVLVL